MGRHKLDESVKKKNQVQFRVDGAMYLKLSEAARNMGLDVGPYVRWYLMQNHK